MRISNGTTALTIASGALGIIAALTLSAPTAFADPVPVIPAPPAPAVADPAIPTPGPTPGPAADGTVQEAAGPLPTPPDGMQHLASPENLPPGTTDIPDPQQGRGSYLRDLWHAYQTQEISGRDALLLLSQRPMDQGYQNAATPPAAVPGNPAPPPLASDAAPPSPPTADPAPAPPPPLFPWLAPPPEAAP